MGNVRGLGLSHRSPHAVVPVTPVWGGVSFAGDWQDHLRL